MTTPVHLISEHASHELVEVLAGLLEAARSGAMNGIIFGASFKGQRYYCDTAGALHRNHVIALGVSTMLTADIEHRIRRRAEDTIL